MLPILVSSIDVAGDIWARGSKGHCRLGDYLTNNPEPRWWCLSV